MQEDMPEPENNEFPAWYRPFKRDAMVRGVYEKAGITVHSRRLALYALQADWVAAQAAATALSAQPSLQEGEKHNGKDF